MEATISTATSGPVSSSNGPTAEVRTTEKSPYKVLGRLDSDPQDVYRLFRTVKAEGPADARRQVIEGNNEIEKAVENGQIELVAVSARFWSSKRPALEVTKNLDA